MKKQVMLIGITLMFVIISLSGCNEDDEPPFDPLLQQEYSLFI